MGIPTLISTATADGDSVLDITSGIDSTYDEYMFVCTDIGPALNGEHFTFQCNAAGASGFNTTMTTTFFDARHTEADGDAVLGYRTGQDAGQLTSYQILALSSGYGADESMAGILHLFTPSNTTYVTYFNARFQNYGISSYSMQHWIAGYFNVTTAIDEISFKMSGGNFDGVIQMYGIS